MEPLHAVWSNHGCEAVLDEGDEVDEMTPEPQDGISWARGNVWSARGAFPVS